MPDEIEGVIGLTIFASVEVPDREDIELEEFRTENLVATQNFINVIDYSRAIQEYHLEVFQANWEWASLIVITLLTVHVGYIACCFDAHKDRTTGRNTKWGDFLHNILGCLVGPKCALKNLQLCFYCCSSCRCCKRLKEEAEQEALREQEEEEEEEKEEEDNEETKEETEAKEQDGSKDVQKRRRRRRDSRVKRMVRKSMRKRVRKVLLARRMYDEKYAQNDDQGADESKRNDNNAGAETDGEDFDRGFEHVEARVPLRWLRAVAYDKRGTITVLPAPEAVKTDETVETQGGQAPEKERAATLIQAVARGAILRRGRRKGRSLQHLQMLSGGAGRTKKGCSNVRVGDEIVVVGNVLIDAEPRARGAQIYAAIAAAACAADVPIAGFVRVTLRRSMAGMVRRRSRRLSSKIVWMSDKRISKSRDGGWEEDKSGLEIVKERIHDSEFPRWEIIALLVVFQGLGESTANIIVNGGASTMYFAIFILVSVYVVGFIGYGSYKLYCEVYPEPEEKSRPGYRTKHVVWNPAEGAWVDRPEKVGPGGLGSYIRKWGPLFESYKSKRAALFFLVVFTLPVELMRGIVIGILQDDEDADTQTYLLLGSFVLETFMYIFWRPFACSDDNMLSAVGSAEMVAILGMSFIPVDEETGNLPVWAELTMLFIVTMVSIIFPMGLSIYRRWSSIKEGLRRKRDRLVGAVRSCFAKSARGASRCVEAACDRRRLCCASETVSVEEGVDSAAAEQQTKESFGTTSPDCEGSQDAKSPPPSTPPPPSPKRGGIWGRRGLPGRLSAMEALSATPPPSTPPPPSGLRRRSPQQRGRKRLPSPRRRAPVAPSPVEPESPSALRGGVWGRHGVPAPPRGGLRQRSPQQRGRKRPTPPQAAASSSDDGEWM
jgi:hypothetical protein